MNLENEQFKKSFVEMGKDFEGFTPVISESRLTEICENDPLLEKLKDDMIEYFVRYAIDVWSMHQFLDSGSLNTEEGAKEFAEMDSMRTRLHTALVDSIAILSRALGGAGKDNTWVQELSAGGHGLSRASCGTFALLLVYNRYLDKVG